MKASEKLTYLQAVIHFAQLASGDRIHRPQGVHPISLALIDRTVRQAGVRVGLKVFPYSPARAVLPMDIRESTWLALRPGGVSTLQILTLLREAY